MYAIMCMQVSMLRYHVLHQTSCTQGQVDIFSRAMASQTTLSELWRSAPHGRLSPWEVAKALGLREASKEIHGGQPNLPWIAARVSKVGGGHPDRASLHELFAKVPPMPKKCELLGDGDILATCFKKRRMGSESQPCAATRCWQWRHSTNDKRACSQQDAFDFDSDALLAMTAFDKRQTCLFTARRV